MVMILNVGRVPLQVGLVETATGAKTSTRVMGRGRGTVQDGFIVDPNWLALYGKDIKLVDTTPVVKQATTVAPAATTAPTVATKGA